MVQSRYRILAVDDDADVLEFLGHVFKDDYDVFLASDGDNALEILHNNPIDLLITDQRMPQMHGIELIEEANKLNPAMVRILLTGYPEQDSIIDAINRGEVQRYITKPFEIDQLRSAIRESLETYQRRLDKERLLADQQLRLNALTVFLDLSREAAQAGSYEEIVRAVIKYLPYLVEFDACAALVEQDTSGRSLLHIHCRHAIHEEPLLQIRDGVLATYLNLTKRRLEEKSLLLQVTGERAQPEGPSVSFDSRLSVLLRP
jgi:response regulator RpfG family c-di-GMP phosphodiesterase